MARGSRHDVRARAVDGTEGRDAPVHHEDVGGPRDIAEDTGDESAHVDEGETAQRMCSVGLRGRLSGLDGLSAVSVCRETGAVNEPSREASVGLRERTRGAARAHGERLREVVVEVDAGHCGRIGRAPSGNSCPRPKSAVGMALVGEQGRVHVRRADVRAPVDRLRGAQRQPSGRNSKACVTNGAPRSRYFGVPLPQYQRPSIGSDAEPSTAYA